jgi:sugar phosphate isomerase/epimerase
MSGTKKNITIGIGEWGFRALPMSEHFQIAKKFGFQWLEFGIGGDQVGRLSEAPDQAEIDEFKALGTEYGIKTPFCCIENDFTLADADEHAAMVEKVNSQIQAAAACGATHVRLFAGFTPAGNVTGEIWGRMIDAFAQCDELCEELGLLIGIETHGGIEFNDDGSATHINSVTTDAICLQRLLTDLPPRVGFNYDPGNIKAVNPDDKMCLLELLNDRINYCHLKDWSRRGQSWVAGAIGDDDLDYQPIFEQLKFDGICQIEYEPLEDTEDGIQRSLDYLGRIEQESDIVAFNL